ncbi:MAG: hypothetical protein HQL26_09155 [Candidatus Omnitrophica bacterium]|nr:hypothetical protein [Candidatus Omnitrophota bacterium]
MKKDKKISFEITLMEEEKIKDAIFLEPFLYDNLRKTKQKGRNKLVSFDVHDLFDLISALRECAHFSKSYKRQQETKKFINRLSEYLTLIYNNERYLGV